MRAILAVAGVVLLTSLVVLGVRGGGDAGDPTAMDVPTETGAATDGSTAAGGDSGSLDPTEGSDEATPAPTDDEATDDSGTDDQTDAAGEDATEPSDDATGAGDGDDAEGDDGDSGGAAEPAGSGSDDDQSGDEVAGEGSSDAGSGDDGSAADDVDDMPDTGVAGVIPLAGLALAGLALRLRR